MKEEGFTKSFKLIEGLGQAKAKRKASSLSCLGVRKTLPSLDTGPKAGVAA
jgi:hypothetical protein